MSKSKWRPTVWRETPNECAKAEAFHGLPGEQTQETLKVAGMIDHPSMTSIEDWNRTFRSSRKTEWRLVPGCGPTGTEPPLSSDYRR